MELEFPIIALKDNDNMVYFLKEKRNLYSTTESLLKKNIHQSSFLIDASGKCYKPLNIKKVGYIGFFGFNPLLKDWWKDREIHIEIQFANDVEQLELADLKKMTLFRIEKSKKFWQAAWNINDFKYAIEKAQGFKELILLFK